MTEDQQRHGLVRDLQQLALELGQTPNIDQARSFIKEYRKRISFLRLGHPEACIMAGLAPVQGQKIDNRIFEKDINKHLE